MLLDADGAAVCCWSDEPRVGRGDQLAGADRKSHTVWARDRARFGSRDDRGRPRPCDSLLMDERRRIFTMGHSTHTIEDFLALLSQHEVKLLADVRSYPSSRRWPHFNQEELKHA